MTPLDDGRQQERMDGVQAELDRLAELIPLLKPHNHRGGNMDFREGVPKDYRSGLFVHDVSYASCTKAVTKVGSMAIASLIANQLCLFMDPRRVQVYCPYGFDLPGWWKGIDPGRTMFWEVRFEFDMDRVPW